jgi:O-antigen/teichoic acid export membrane protein
MQTAVESPQSKDAPRVPRRRAFGIMVKSWFAGGLGPNLAATATILLFNLATGVLLAHAFDPEGRGEVALILIWPNMLTAFARLGLPEALTFHTARGDHPTGAVLGSGLVIATVRAVVVLAIAAAILPFVLGPHGSDVLRAGYVYLGYIPADAYGNVMLGVLNGEERYRAVSILRVLVIAAAAIPLFIVFGLGDLTLMSLAIIYVAAAVMVSVLGALLLRRTLRSLTVSRGLSHALLHYGVRAHLGTISTTLNARVDQLVVSLFLPVHQLGLYTIAATMSAVSGWVGLSVGYVALPTLARAEGDEERLVGARRFTRLTLLGSTAISIPVAIFAPQLIHIVFGSAYVQVADVARVLMISTIAYSAARCLEAILRALNMPWQASLGEVIALAVTAVALAVLLPLLGLMGAALASLLAYATSMVWMLRVTSRRLGISLRALLL